MGCTLCFPIIAALRGFPALQDHRGFPDLQDHYRYGLSAYLIISAHTLWIFLTSRTTTGIYCLNLKQAASLERSTICPFA